MVSFCIFYFHQVQTIAFENDIDRTCSFFNALFEGFLGFFAGEIKEQFLNKSQVTILQRRPLSKTRPTSNCQHRCSLSWSSLSYTTLPYETPVHPSSTTDPSDTRTPGYILAYLWNQVAHQTFKGVEFQELLLAYILLEQLKSSIIT